MDDNTPVGIVDRPAQESVDGMVLIASSLPEMIDECSVCLGRFGICETIYDDIFGILIGSAQCHCECLARRTATL